VSGRALPVPTPETQTYWDKAAEHELWLPKCADTDRWFFPPRERSPFTGGEVIWRRASGRATLASYVINHRPAPGYEGIGPYVIAIVGLEEGPRLISNLLDIPAEPQALQIGMKLEVTFENRGVITVPQFRRAGGETGA
jgi:uncharacterized OB-fold protein